MEEDSVTCPKCLGKKNVRRKGRIERCSCVYERKHKEVSELLGLPLPHKSSHDFYTSLSLSKSKAKELLKIYKGLEQRFETGREQNIFHFHGPLSKGKESVASDLLFLALSRGKKAIATCLLSISQDFHNSLYACDLCILDLGAGYSERDLTLFSVQDKIANETRTLSLVVSKAFALRKPLILLSYQTISQRFGSRLTSDLVQVIVPIEINGQVSAPKKSLSEGPPKPIA